MHTKKKRLAKEFGEEDEGHLEMLADVAEHSLLPNIEIWGDDRSVKVHSHSPSVFTNASELPQRVESVLMEFGVGGTEGSETLGHMELTSMPYTTELRRAGNMIVRLADTQSKGGAFTAFASSPDETWAVGVVERIRKATGQFVTKNYLFHSNWFRYLVQTACLAVFFSGVSLLTAKLLFHTRRWGPDDPLPIMILVAGAVLGWALSLQLLKYIRWLSPLLEIDPPPLDMKARHRRTIYWLVTVILLPFVLGILIKYL